MEPITIVGGDWLAQRGLLPHARPPLSGVRFRWQDDIRRVPAVGAAARVGLSLVALAQAEVGVWGLLAPHSFYATFPGAGRHWVSVLGPYDEHLVRDFAAMELGFAVLLACAVVWFERRLVLVAGAAFLAATLPHFAYHLTTTDQLSAADDLASLGGFAIELALVVAAMVVITRPDVRAQSFAEVGGAR